MTGMVDKGLLQGGESLSSSSRRPDVALRHGETVKLLAWSFGMSTAIPAGAPVEMLQKR